MPEPTDPSNAEPVARPEARKRSRRDWFIRRRMCWVPTWQAVVLGLLILGVGTGLFFRSLYSLLAVSDPIAGAPFIVEGWIGEWQMPGALAVIRAHPSPIVLVVGGPIEPGSVYTSYGTYARLGAAQLVQKGADPQMVRAVDAPGVQRDRTFAEARHAQDWLRQHGFPTDRINVISVGPHSRRSRLLYEKAFGPQTQVGICALPDTSYDPNHWWRSSSGFRTVISEAIAYGYARFFFREGAE